MRFEKIKKQFPALRKNEPLKNHCTFRVGGPAKFFYELKNIEELPSLVEFAEENSIKYKIIGRGTNVLFTDKGFGGLIIKNLSNNCRMEGEKIICDSGAVLAQIIRLSVENGLTGMEPLYGIPGTVGGAIWGNAGVPETCICDFVEKISVFCIDDGFYEIFKNDLKRAYRWTSLQESDDVILQAHLRLKKIAAGKSEKLLQQIARIRSGKQPAGYSAGSFFKNPSSNSPAGMLIDKAGLKGARIGDAEISPKHANFFMNCGNATADEILALAQKAQKKVKEKFGVDLQMEVKIIGDL